MAKRAKESEPSEPEYEGKIVKTVDPLADEPVEMNSIPEPPLSPPPSPVTTTAAPSGPSFGERVGAFFRFLLRLFLLLIVLGLLGIALYMLLPVLYQRYIRPVERNTAQVQELQSWREQTEQELADLQSKLGSLEDAQSQQDRALAELDERMIGIETEIAARSESLAALEDLQSEMEAQNQAISAELERQINLLKAMELLSRARMSMYQSNFGLAQQDVQIARDLLAEAVEEAPEALAAELEAVILRLDMTLANLPDFPVAASDDLDIAWQILLSGMPPVTPTVEATPTVAGTPSATPGATLTPQPTSTP